MYINEYVCFMLWEVVAVSSQNMARWSNLDHLPRTILWSQHFVKNSFPIYPLDVLGPSSWCTSKVWLRKSQWPWHHGRGQGLHAQCWTAVGWGQPCSSALRCRCSAGCFVRSRLGNLWSSYLRRCNGVLWWYDVTCSEMMLHVWHDMTWKAHPPRLAPRQLARGNPRGRWKPWRPHSCCGALQEWP